MKIEFSKTATGDMDSIISYYRQQGVEKTGRSFIPAIIASVQTLKNHPEIGRIVPEFDNKKIREIVKPPFRIVYLHQGKMISVIRIYRSERLLRLSDL
ncbi:MAG: type II toxin-antitoxin system RelE/ParE family toxin [Methylococcales symbiont of Iophon sp. n. MRB-2018]|nr:MAG: type II toxin-antitoxin system RelE/ParE family toxin [Methylococcales symbiont of Iophon sp. n. MRB-2018]KAF3978977.1 MAG: type II toxin-antitoxin system RelE/ParE family toxin [Methylococcales symbiont of Iophon sp. n. MRB-2018]